MRGSNEIALAERVAPWVVGILFAIPVLLVKYPPMDDLALHEAPIGLLRHWGDSRFAPPSLYFVNLGHANQLFSLLALPLAFVMSTAMATKVVVAGSLLGLSLGAARFARHLDAPTWTALLIAPLGLGWLFFWGLIQNILGLAVLLALLPVIDDFASRPTARRALYVCGAMLLLHFAHQAMQLVACGALLLCCLGAPLRARELSIRAVPLVFSGLVVYAAQWYAWRFAGPRHHSTAAYTFSSVEHKLVSIPGVLFGGFEPYVRNLMMAIAVVALGLFALDRVRPPAAADVEALEDAAPARGLGARLHAYRFEILAAVLFVVYALAPLTVKSTTLVYHRFLPPAWALVAVCAGAGTRGRGRRLAPVVCAALPAGTLLIAWPTFVDADRVFSDLADVTASVQPGSSIMTLDLGPDPPHRLWSPMSSMGYVVADHGGRSLFDYTQSPVSPVAQRSEKQWSEPMDRMKEDPYQMRPDWDFTRFRYVLFTTPKLGLGEALPMALESEANLVAQKGDWYLFESRLPVVPIDADDAPLPMPHPASLRKKLKELSERLRKQIEAGATGAGAPVEPTPTP